ncbi:hypothetical protein [Ghiorsea bivora]|uniref:hypothetical protein n=1 Tax=Ghiorsea bivora TaxID=1485545 RepID=UPI00056F9370|nr:hypothetical protein [Ghiorsea bivora]
MEIDGWQWVGSIAAMSFTFGFVDQVRVTYKTKCVLGLSLVQWVVFATASLLFVAYYGHLEQWLMLSVSVFGFACCFAVVVMIFWFSKAGINDE